MTVREFMDMGELGLDRITLYTEDGWQIFRDKIRLCYTAEDPDNEEHYIITTIENEYDLYNREVIEFRWTPCGINIYLDIEQDEYFPNEFDLMPENERNAWASHFMKLMDGFLDYLMEHEEIFK